MRVILSMLLAGLLAAPATAQWYARGDFNGFEGNDYPLVAQGDDYYTITISDLFADVDQEFKIANEDWSLSAPGNNAKVRTNAEGQLNLHFWDITEWGDGWSPNNQRRVGYDDPEAFGWEIIGTFNDWPAEGDPNFYLTSEGDGLYTGEFEFDAGIYSFKFRQQGSWDVSIGNGDFSNSGADNVFAVLSDGDLWNFELDLPNGRWRAFTDAVPPPRPGDYNGDGAVDAADYTGWRDGLIDGSEGFNTWKTNFGAGAGPQPWYLRGDFNDFGLDNVMEDQGDGYYTTTISGLNPGEGYDYKVARADWSEFEPVNNGTAHADDDGEITFHFHDDTNPDDGWSPNKRRVGYDDHDQFDWELMGDMNGWTGGEQWFLTDTGDGLHRIEVELTAGNYQFKFRQQNNWDVNIGSDFGNHATNGMVSLDSDGIWAFELDLPGGRWRAVLAGGGASLSSVPEPASIVMLLFAAFGYCPRRR